MANRESLLATEATVQYVSSRLAKVGLCATCGAKVDSFLEGFLAEIRRRKVEEIELELGQVDEDLVEAATKAIG